MDPKRDIARNKKTGGIGVIQADYVNDIIILSIMSLHLPTILIVLTGLGMLFFGLKLLVRLFGAKVINVFPLSNGTVGFQVDQKGLYSICILGAGYVKNSGGFNVSICNVNSQRRIDVNEQFIKFTFYKDREIAVEYLHFKVNESGVHKMELKNIDGLIFRTSFLRSKQLFHSPMHVGKLRILIRETLPDLKKLLAIALTVLGVNMLVWGIVMGINPDLFRSF